MQKIVQRTAEQDRALAWAHDWRTPLIRMEGESWSAGKAIIDTYARLVLQPFDFGGASSSGVQGGLAPRPWESS